MENETMKEARRRAREEVEKMPGLKLRQLEPCMICGDSPLEAKDNLVPGFYRVKIERYLPNPGGLMEIQGLAMNFMGRGANPLGAVVMSDIMGQNPDVVKRIGVAGEFLVCESCAMKDSHVLLRYMELWNEKHPEPTDDGDDVPLPKPTTVSNQD